MSTSTYHSRYLRLFKFSEFCSLKHKRNVGRREIRFFYNTHWCLSEQTMPYTATCAYSVGGILISRTSKYHIDICGPQVQQLCLPNHERKARKQIILQYVLFSPRQFTCMPNNIERIPPYDPSKFMQKNLSFSSYKIIVDLNCRP